MPFSHKTITYPLGTILELHCVEYWPDLTGDYEIIGFTSMPEMKLMGLDFYKMHIETQNQIDFYTEFLEKTQPYIYIMKKINRNPYLAEDDDLLTDMVDEYIYVADSMIDKNASIKLVKRVYMTGDIVVGTFYDYRVDDAFKEKIIKEFITVLDDYSDKYKVNDFKYTTVLQPDYEAEEEDRDFLEKQKRLEEERQAAIEKEKRRLELLTERERYVTLQESVLRSKRKEIQALYDEAVALKEEADAIRLKALRLQESLELRELELADQTAKLNARAQRIYDRETQLGLPHTNL